MLTPLCIPPDLPAHTREFLTQLDTAITNAAVIASFDPDSYRMSAREYRRTGLELNARDADRVADWIELDPRLMVAGTMDRVSEGITRWFLRKYITLIEQQAKAARTNAWPTWSAGMPARGLPRGGNRPPAGAELRQIPVRKRDGADRIVDADLRGVEGPQ